MFLNPHEMLGNEKNLQPSFYFFSAERLFPHSSTHTDQRVYSGNIGQVILISSPSRV